MTRLEHTLEDLNRKGYALSSLKQLNGGINSSVFEANSDSGVKYVIKLYPLPTKYDSRNRCLTEKKFLDYLKSCKIRNTPSLLESNTSAGWSLISWVEGQKPLSLQPSDLQDIANFIDVINEASTEAIRFQLEPASEACQSLSGLISSIAERLTRLQSSTPSSGTCQEAIHWVTDYCSSL